MGYHEDADLERNTHWFGRVIKEDRTFWIWFNQQGAMRALVHNTASLFVIGYGVWRVSEHDWTIGMLYPLLSWNGWVTSNLWRIGYIEHRINWNTPAVRSMMEALTMTPDIVDKETAISLNEDEPFLAFAGILFCERHFTTKFATTKVIVTFKNTFFIVA